MRRGSVLAILEERLPGLAKGYSVKSLYLFGSTARDQATLDSDVDFIVRFEHYIGLKHQLEDLLSKVDLVAKKVPAELRPHLEADALQLI